MNRRSTAGDCELETPGRERGGEGCGVKGERDEARGVEAPARVVIEA